jgi:hypothetical protein
MPQMQNKPAQGLPAGPAAPRARLVCLKDDAAFWSELRGPFDQESGVHFMEG